MLGINGKRPALPGLQDRLARKNHLIHDLSLPSTPHHTTTFDQIMRWGENSFFLLNLGKRFQYQNSTLLQVID